MDQLKCQTPFCQYNPEVGDFFSRKLYHTNRIYKGNEVKQKRLSNSRRTYIREILSFFHTLYALHLCAIPPYDGPKTLFCD